MDTFELMRQVGLSKKEASIYASLIDQGQQSLSSLHRSTQINRPALYEVLPILERKGLVSKVKQKSRYQYVAESPKKLLRQYQERVEKDVSGLKDLSKVFEEHNDVRPVVKYFEGEHGVNFVFDDIIHTLPIGGEYCRYSSRVKKDAKRFEKTLYYRERDKKKIERLVITGIESTKSMKSKLERSVRVVPEEFDLFEDNISLLIYGNKTAYVDYGSKTSFIIESEKIARFQEKIFKLLWKKLK